MQKSKPLLSICIPTYNRAKLLEKSLKSIIHQNRFDEIEVVISDNCSTDRTKQIAEKYTSKYENIKYYRNDKNIKDENFPKVLNLATGCLRKLSNDKIVYVDGAIEKILIMIENCISTKPSIYFLNGSRKTNRNCEVCNSVDEFMKKVSFMITNIGLVALWDEDCQEDSICLSTMKNHSESYLGQVPCIIESIKRHKTVMIQNEYLMTSLSVGRKDLSYGLYQVFYKNYMGFIKQYQNERLISDYTCRYLRKDILLNFFSVWTASMGVNKDQYIVSDENLKELIKEEYKKEKYYYIYWLKMHGNILKYKLLRIYRN